MKTYLIKLTLIGLWAISLFFAYQFGFGNGFEDYPKFHKSGQRLIRLQRFESDGFLWINPDTIDSMEDLAMTEGYDGRIIPQRTKIINDEGSLFLVKETTEEIQKIIDSPPDTIYDNGIEYKITENKSRYEKLKEIHPDIPKEFEDKINDGWIYGEIPPLKPGNEPDPNISWEDVYVVMPNQG